MLTFFARGVKIDIEKDTFFKRRDTMVVVKGIDIKQNFKSICDRVFNGETMIISRPRNENIVLISESEYDALQKARTNAEYIEKNQSKI